METRNSSFFDTTSGRSAPWALDFFLSLWGVIYPFLGVHFEVYSTKHIVFKKQSKANNPRDSSGTTPAGRPRLGRQQQPIRRQDYIYGPPSAHYYINQIRLRIMSRTCLRRHPSKHSQNGKEAEQVFRYAAVQEDKNLELIKLCRKDTAETEDEHQETEQDFGSGHSHNDYIELLSNSELKDFVDYEEETQACLF